jgi:adenylate cyclase
VLALLLGHAAQYYRVDSIARLDAIFHDAKVRLTLPGTVDDRIVIIDIDQHSLAEIGRWPWGRDRLAQLVTAAFDRYGVRLMGLDLILAEADQSSGLKVLDDLASGVLRDDARFRAGLDSLRPQLDHYRQFAQVMSKHPVVLSYSFTRRGRNSGALPAPLLPGGRRSCGHDG